jgi:hypothetical protein
VHPAQYMPPFAWGNDGERMTEDGFLTVAERVLARRNVELTETRRDSLRQTYRRGTRDEHALRAGLGLARELLRGGARRVRGAHRRRVQRSGDRAAGGAHRTRAGARRRYRADPRARRPRPRRRAPGAPARYSGGHRRRHLEPARSRGWAPRSIAPWVLRQRGAGTVPGERLPHQPRRGGAAGGGGRGRRRSQRSGWPTISAGHAAVRYLLGSSVRSCWRPTTTTSCSAPAATRRWCSGESPARADISPTGPRPSSWPSCTIRARRRGPGSPQPSVQFGGRRASDGGARAQAGGLRGVLHIADQDEPLGRSRSAPEGAAQTGALRGGSQEGRYRGRAAPGWCPAAPTAVPRSRR